MEERDQLKKYWLSQKAFIDYLLTRLDEQPVDNIRFLDAFPDFWIHPWVMAEELSRINQLLRELKTQTVSQCAFSNVSGGDAPVKMLVAPSKRKEGLREIKDFTKSADSLIVIDPYIYGGYGRESNQRESNQAEQYVAEFKKTARLDNLKSLHVIFNKKHGNTTKIKKEFNKITRELGCQFSHQDTDKIHDRIWIKDKQEAIVVGTSLGGLGNKLSFILELPSSNLADLLKYLQNEGLLSKK
jgi:hypothetical protein